MPTVITLSGSPSLRSRSNGLLGRAERILSSYGIDVHRFSLSDFPAEDLVFGNFNSPAVIHLQNAINLADGLIIATPVYKAAYSGALKLVLDLLPERALQDKVVLPIATGGSPGHMLAVDYALQPVLSALKARHIVGGIYATDKDLQWQDDQTLDIAPDIDQRLQSSLARFIAHLPNPGSVQVDPNTLHSKVRQASVGI